MPNYQQRTWEEFFNLLNPLIMYMFSKAGPLTPSAPSGRKLSPQVSTLCQKGPPGGALISYSWGKVHPCHRSGHRLEVSRQVQGRAADGCVAVRLPGDGSSQSSGWPGRVWGGGHSSPGQSPFDKQQPGRSSKPLPGCPWVLEKYFRYVLCHAKG